jgi:hypothetical protein
MQAQESFYDVYNDISNLQKKFAQDYTGIHGNKRDSIENNAQASPEVKQYYADLDIQLKRLVNKHFPDITFSGIHNEHYMLSDFQEELVINYNYPYCMTCIQRIDSTQKRTDKKNIRVLVLFSEVYKKDISFLKPFNENVIFGFINQDIIDLISFSHGDDCMYFLDKTNRIEFFDMHDHEAWTAFLDKRLK